MIYAAALLAATCFMIALRAMAIPAITARVLTTGREAARVMGDKSIEDDDKERLMQQASVQLLKTFVSISARAAAALVAGAIPLAMLHAAGIVPLAAVGAFLATWQGIALTAVGMTLVYFVKTSS